MEGAPSASAMEVGRLWTQRAEFRLFHEDGEGAPSIASPSIASPSIASPSITSRITSMFTPRTKQKLETRRESMFLLINGCAFFQFGALALTIVVLLDLIDTLRGASFVGLVLLLVSHPSFSR